MLDFQSKVSFQDDILTAVKHRIFSMQNISENAKKINKIKLQTYFSLDKEFTNSHLQKRKIPEISIARCY